MAERKFQVAPRKPKRKEHFSILDAGILPNNVAAFLDDIFGNVDSFSPPITEKHLSEEEKWAMLQKAKAGLRKGKIEYKDQGGEANVGGSILPSLLALLENTPEYKNKTLLGQSAVRKTPKGKLKISDQYNFNDATNEGIMGLLEEQWDHAENLDLKAISPYHAARATARHFGSPGGQGRRVSITLDPDMKKPEPVYSNYDVPYIWRSLLDRKGQ